MDQPVVTFARRRTLLVGISLAVGAGLAWLHRAYDLWLRDASFPSGWLVLGGIVVLALYNMRKKLPFLPLGSAAAWLQLHIYLALLTVVAFLLHTSARLPQGALETVLWCLFAAVAITGVLGILLTRILPSRLQRGERLIFERIPQLRAELAEEVQALAMRSVAELASNTIAQYYAARLHSFFRGPRDVLAHLVDSDAPLGRMRGEIASLRRYMDERERQVLEEIETRVILKSNLDRQFALHAVLKGWLFLHIPLTYALLLVAAVHVVLAYAFTSSTL